VTDLGPASREFLARQFPAEEPPATTIWHSVINSIGVISRDRSPINDPTIRRSTVVAVTRRSVDRSVDEISDGGPSDDQTQR